MPLIRYEISDRVRLSRDGCACGLAVPGARGHRGREEDVLDLPGPTGRVIVHPNVVHAALDGVRLAVVDDHDAIDLLLVPASSPLDLDGARRALEVALTRSGARVPVTARIVDESRVHPWARGR
ncbi:hypothetical protein [Cellulomonas carbonis]|uniref:hypothetical protein n=1 Tax=Cellulomonas carbonis TaxID=1386092 RepID=UPI001269EC11|nr:hypothetical protein [Cellulomonas carbonis]